MRTGETGMALMIALWAILLIGAFVTGMVAVGGGDAAITANRIDAARAQLLAAAGARQVIAALVDPLARQKLPLAQVFSVRLDDDAEITVQVRDSCGAIDLNWAPQAVLRAYAVTAGMTPAAAGTFADAVVARQHLAAAKHAEELNTGPWQSLDQLAAIPGVDPGLLSALRPGLTVNCREAGADACCAIDAVKKALRLAGADGSPSHRLAYEIEAQASLPLGTKATVHVAIWLSREPGPPYYYITGWRAQ